MCTTNDFSAQKPELRRRDGNRNPADVALRLL
jgi:hypothetical protein